MARDRASSGSASRPTDATAGRGTATAPRRSRRFRAALGRYARLALATALIGALIAFAIQNAGQIHVRFLAWEADLSQALVVFGALVAGAIVGLAGRTWIRWRAAVRQRSTTRG